MSKLLNIPVKVETGEKYKNNYGINAVKNGLRNKKNTTSKQHDNQRKPKWLKIEKAEINSNYNKLKKMTSELHLSTVCEEAHCPNIGECWSHGTATIMLLGGICTRACKFCAVDTGNPKGWLDPNEPEKTAQTVQAMNLNYIVLTSVDRDDLDDGGAEHYAKAISAIKNKMSKIKVEALTPDFAGNVDSVRKIINSNVDVFAHNVETVERLTSKVRDPRAKYWQSINVLHNAKKLNKKILTKTSLMLGLGETHEEILLTMDHLIEIKVDILTLGQYLQPTKNHLEVYEYITPEQFKLYRKIGLEKGFLEVASGPMVRSSYRADKIFTKDNLGLD